MNDVRKFFCSAAILINAAAILLLASGMLENVTAENAADDRQRIMQQLLPGSSTFTAEEYEGKYENISRVFKGESGYVVESTAEGYVDEMVLWVGVDNSGLVTGVTVRDMAETTGLGSRAMSDVSFLKQFLGTSGYAEIGHNIDALSGATVTSSAVAWAVNSASAFVTGADVSSGATVW